MPCGDKSRRRVAVLFGGPSDEYRVSCGSAANVVRSLDKKRFAVTPIRVDKRGVWIVGEEAGPNQAVDLDALLHMTRETLLGGSADVRASVARAIVALDEFDVVFPVLHGAYGEDGTVQGLLELIGMPYVGNGLLASAVGMDKQQTKRLLASKGMAVADGVVLEGDAASIDEPTRVRLGLPVFVKPARGGSSIGVSKVSCWSDLDRALALARVSDSKVLVEAAVPGREVDVAVLQYPDGTVRAGPPLEILLPQGNQFFDYAAKYEDTSVVFKIPAELEPEIATLLREEAVRVFRTLGCSGLLRVDFFLRPKGNTVQLVVNEVNTLPGLTALSQYPRIWKAAGIDYPDLLALLIDTAMTTNRQFSPR